MRAPLDLGISDFFRRLLFEKLGCRWSPNYCSDIFVKVLEFSGCEAVLYFILDEAFLFYTVERGYNEHWGHKKCLLKP